MIQLDTTLARHEIDRRLRAVGHHRRVRWGRIVRRYAGRPACLER
jgi:hypothetical protein